MLTIGYDTNHKFIAYGATIGPVIAELNKLPGCEVIPYNPEDPSRTASRFDAIFSCAMTGGANYPTKRLIYLPHGLSPWKGTRYKDKPTHYLCCSPWEVGKYFNTKTKKGIVVGWPKLDYLVANSCNRKIFRDKIIEMFGLDPSLPIVAYMPTWSADKQTKKNMIRRGTIRKMLDPDFPYIPNMVLAPHYSDLRDSSPFLQIVKSFPSVYNLPNKNDLLLGCDLILGDISSILVESLVLDIPIVHIHNGDREMFRAYKDNRKQSEICTLGPVVDRLKDLKTTIDSCLISKSDPFAALRKVWRDRFIYIPKETATVAATNAIYNIARGRL